MSMVHKSRVREMLLTRLRMYDTRFFPEPPPKQHGKTVDECSAAMGRFLLQSLLDELEEMGEDHD